MKIFPSRYVWHEVRGVVSTPFLAVEKVFPEDRDRLGRMSLIEGGSYESIVLGHFYLYIFTEGFPKQVRMAHLAVIGSRKVNGVAEVRFHEDLHSQVSNLLFQLHSDLVRTTILKDFVEFEGLSKSVSFP